MSKPTILVTGGMGYIGSHTVVELINAGFEVIIIDSLINSDPIVLDGIEEITGERPVFEEIDLCDGGLLEERLKKYKNLKGVIHFAALKAVGESVEKSLLYYENNLFSLVNILKAMKTFNIPNIVFSSSCTVYGQPDELPVTESAPFKKAESPYGNTKQICEDILLDTTISEKDIHAISLRYFNPTGAHESAIIGELPQGVPNNLVPYITQTAEGIREKLSVFGGDYNTADGTCVRDYIHVVDLAKAHVISINRMLDNKCKASYEFFNLGTGKGSTVLEVIKAFEKTNGITINHEIVDRRSGDIEQSYASTTLANDELGWKTEKNIEDMMSSAWAWEQNYRKNIEPMRQATKK